MFIAVISDKGKRKRERFLIIQHTLCLQSFNAVNPVDKNKFLLLGGATRATKEICKISRL